MPRYIDADLLIEQLQPAKNAEWNKNDHTASRSQMIEDFCTELKNAPTADVVQKSEVERLSHKCDECAGCTQWKCDCANIELEVAREIFAEIETDIDIKISVTKEFLYKKGGRTAGKTIFQTRLNVLNELDEFFSELKKKYTEGEE